jgi:hypothetical protein
MKSLLLLCVFALITLADSCSDSPKTPNTPPSSPPAADAQATPEEALCDECICGACREVSQQVPKDAQPCPPVVESKWDLWRAGTCLRGVNAWQKTEEGADGQAAVTSTYRPEDFKELTTFKANYVNLSFPGIYSVKPKGGKYVLEPKVLTELTQLVERLDRANLFVVVSFRTGPGRSESVFGGEEGEEVVTDLWKSDSDAARRAWVEMWLKASEALRDKANVVGYDLMVEPVGDKEKVAGRPGEAKAENEKRYALWYGLAGRIAQAIRDANDTTPILVGGANASPACALECLPALKLPGIVYTVHQYEPYTYTHQAVGKEGEEEEQHSNYNCEDLSNASPKPRYVGRPRRTEEKLERIYALINGYRQNHGGVPVAVNEFGVFRWAPKAKEHLSDEMAILERLGANHALWLWEPGDDQCSGYDEFNFRHGTDFSTHKDVSRNPLYGAIKDNWNLNKVFPRNVTFKPAARRG